MIALLSGTMFEKDFPWRMTTYQGHWFMLAGMIVE
jgi:hypothetical protein